MIINISKKSQIPFLDLVSFRNAKFLVILLKKIFALLKIGMIGG